MAAGRLATESLGAERKSHENIAAERATAQMAAERQQTNERELYDREFAGSVGSPNLVFERAVFERSGAAHVNAQNLVSDDTVMAHRMAAMRATAARLEAESAVKVAAAERWQLTQQAAAHQVRLQAMMPASSMGYSDSVSQGGVPAAPRFIAANSFPHEQQAQPQLAHARFRPSSGTSEVSPRLSRFVPDPSPHLQASQATREVALATTPRLSQFCPDNDSAALDVTPSRRELIPDLEQESLHLMEFIPSHVHSGQLQDMPRALVGEALPVRQLADSPRLTQFLPMSRGNADAQSDDTPRLSEFIPFAGSAASTAASDTADLSNFMPDEEYLQKQDLGIVTDHTPRLTHFMPG
jgi:hypothetical protein